MNDEIKLKEIELKLENLKSKRIEKYHNFRMEELRLRLDIAKLYHNKKKVKKILKELEKK
jgi:hypothetical protein